LIVKKTKIRVSEGGQNRNSILLVVYNGYKVKKFKMIEKDSFTRVLVFLWITMWITMWITVWITFYPHGYPHLIHILKRIFR